MRVETFKYRLAGMKKPDEFIVYLRHEDGSYTVQGDRCIVRVRPGEAKGIINWRGSNPKYFLHLNPALGAELFDVPPEFMSLVENYAPSKGDTLGGGVVRLG